MCKKGAARTRETHIHERNGQSRDGWLPKQLPSEKPSTYVMGPLQDVRRRNVHVCGYDGKDDSPLAL